MRVATFNILHGQPVSGPAAHAAAGNDPDRHESLDPQPFIDSLLELDADVIGLQEVDSGQPRSGLIDQAAAAAQAMGAAGYRFVPTVIGTPGGAKGFTSTTAADRIAAAKGKLTGERLYGIALVSTLPVIAWHSEVFAPAPMSLPLLVQTEGKGKLLKVRDEQRAAIAATVRTNRGIVTIATAHLSFVPGYNVSQLRRVRAWLRDLPRPLILMGDFNLPWPVPAKITKWEPLAKVHTFPSYKPRVQFDHILADGLSAEQLAAARRSSRSVQMLVSDHCALRSDIDL